MPLHDMLVSLLASYSLGPISGSLRWATFLFVLLLLENLFGFALLLGVQLVGGCYQLILG